MPADPAPAAPAPTALGESRHIRIRFVAILAGAAVALLIARHDWVLQRLPDGARLPHEIWRYLAVGMLGGLVGFAEIVSRYRDEPLLATRSPPGRFYVLFNAAAAMIALAMYEHYAEQLHPPADGYSRVMVAGFGAMLILRSKLLTIRQPDGSNVSVGPAFVVDTLVAAINRAVDRWRAQARFIRVARLAGDFKTVKFAEIAPTLASALLAFQNMEPETLKRLSDSIQSLAADTRIDEHAKFSRAAYDILTECGEAVFDRIFADLGDLFLRPPAA